jgi:hypothetical protein
MSQTEQLSELLVRWHEARQRGEALTPEQLCVDCPELLPRVRPLVEALEAMSALRAPMPEPQAAPAAPTECPRVAPASTETFTDQGPGTPAAPSVPGYEVLGELGRGGMGVVYQARQVKLKRPVALKMILVAGHAGLGELDRFRVEAEATGQPITPPIPHRAQVLDAAFSADGRSILAALGSTPQVWDISPADRSPDDWVRLTQFICGKMDRFGESELLSAEELRESWEYLRRKYPQDFTGTPAQALAWHRREAEACLKEKNAPAYLFHYFHGSWEWAILTGWPRM